VTPLTIMHARLTGRHAIQGHRAIKYRVSPRCKPLE